MVENEGLFHMFEADIIYADEALYENKLSVVFDDLLAACEALDRVREFVRAHPTVYMGTYTPQGNENLEAKRVMDPAFFPRRLESNGMLCMIFLFTGFFYKVSDADQWQI